MARNAVESLSMVAKSIGYSAPEVRHVATETFMHWTYEVNIGTDAHPIWRSRTVKENEKIPEGAKDLFFIAEGTVIPGTEPAHDGRRMVHRDKGKSLVCNVPYEWE